MKKIIKTSSGTYIPKQDYSKNLVAKWIFDDTYLENSIKAVDDNKINDLSGNENALISYNLEFKNDKDLGKCAYFNGNNAYCEANNYVIPTHNFSIKIKMKPQMPNTQNNGHKDGILLINNDNKDHDGLEVWVEGDDACIYSNLRYNVASSNHNKINYDKQLDYMITFDEENKKYSTYINNFKTAVNVSPINKSQSTPYNNLMIGRLLNFAYYFKGFIKSIEVYDTCIDFVKYKKFLLEQNNQLYTIKSDFYNHVKLQYSPITEIETNNITDENFKEYGFDDINHILTETTIGNEKFKPIDKLKLLNDGKFNILTKELDL